MQISKKLLLFSSFFLCTSQIIQGSPLFSVGDDLNVFFNGSTALRYDTNITLDESDEIEDLMYIISPGVELNYGRGNSNIKTIFGAHFTFYSDESKFDSTNGFFNTEANYSGARLSLNSLFNFQENEYNSNDANVKGDLVRSRTYNFHVKGSYDLTEKIDLDSGFIFKREDYRNFKDEFNDRNEYSVPFALYYAYSSKLDLSLDYRFRRTSVSGDNNRIDNFFGFGLRGEFAPKLEGKFKAGYQHRDISGDSNEQQLSLDTELLWALSPLTELALALNRDFNTSGTGESAEVTGGALRLKHTFSPFVWTEGTVAYKNYNYQGNREDDNFSTGIAIFYLPVNYLQLSLDYQYLDNDSNLSGSSYRAHVISLVANVRY